ncbi:MAG: DUF5615 family PIN-like protein [Anaerolineae bacterium]|nr:DUF5615 family PIN-like protein [Anaerolineae bacterium]
MTFVADESVEQSIIACLRRAGHKVYYVAELDAGMSDMAVLDLANRESALLLTADKDFGEMVFRQRSYAHGIVLIRLPGISPRQKGELVADALAQHADELTGCFTVISPGMVRIRRMLG